MLASLSRLESLLQLDKTIHLVRGALELGVPTKTLGNHPRLVETSVPFPLDVGIHLWSLLQLVLNLLESGHDPLLLVGDRLFPENKSGNSRLSLSLSSANLFIVKLCKEGKSMSYSVDDTSTFRLWKSLPKGLEIGDVEAKYVGSDTAPRHVLSSVGGLKSVFQFFDVVVHELGDALEHLRIIVPAPCSDTSFQIRWQDTKNWFVEEFGDFGLQGFLIKLKVADFVDEVSSLLKGLFPGDGFRLDGRRRIEAVDR
jgi:hypothetical protein